MRNCARRKSRNSSKGNDGFWRFYRDKPWYSDAFDDEVFNIDPALLKPDDTASVLVGLRGGGTRAQRLARSLAPRWNVETYPALNLEMLLEFASSLDESQYDDVIRQAFRSDSYYNERVCARAFCAFLDKELRPDAEPIAANSMDALFRFLILLLPVDADSNLNSKASDLARRVVARRPARSVELLVESLSYAFTQHRPHVWRLLSLGEARAQSAENGLLARATSELANGLTNERALNQELRRFLEQSGEEPFGGTG